MSQTDILAVGEKVIIRTVTNYYTGKIISIAALGNAGFVVLEDAAWIADTGRFANTLATGQLNEVEPYPGNVAVAIGAVVDISPWNHELPRIVK